MIKEVEQTRQKADIVEHYRCCFKFKYGDWPLSVSGPDRGALESLVVRIKNFKTLMDVMEYYFEIKGDKEWYERQGHDIPTFVKNLKQIHAEFLRNKPTLGNAHWVEMSFKCTATNCCASAQKQKEGFLKVVKADSIEITDEQATIYCPDCHAAVTRLAAKIESEPAYVNKTQQRAIERAIAKQRNSTA